MTAGVPEFGAREDGAVYQERLCVYAVATADTRVAICRVPTGHYLPGGGVDPGEALEEALAREVREELGRACVVGSKIGVAVQHSYAPDEGYFRKTGHFFQVQLGATVGAGEADHELIWLPAAEAHETLRHGFLRWAIAQALDV